MTIGCFEKVRSYSRLMFLSLIHHSSACCSLLFNSSHTNFQSDANLVVVLQNGSKIEPETLFDIGRLKDLLLFVFRRDNVVILLKRKTRNIY